jgi:hypothetical protein
VCVKLPKRYRSCFHDVEGYSEGHEVEHRWEATITSETHATTRHYAEGYGPVVLRIWGQSQGGTP